MPASNETSSIIFPTSKPTLASFTIPHNNNLENDPQQNGCPTSPTVQEVPKEMTTIHSEGDTPSMDGNGNHRGSTGSLPVSAASTSSDSSKSRGSSPYQRVSWALLHDERWTKEVALGKRVGFYRFKGDLGSGNFSQVKLATHQLTKEKVAVKILDKSKLDNKTQLMLNREISIMEQLCHPNVIQLYEVIHSIPKVHLILEYANGGDLFAKITNTGRISEQQAKVIFAQIVSAVDYMHSRNVIHRDLKSENVFFSNPDVVKVGDFGFSTTIRNVDEALKTFCGSPPYAAPELFQDESYIGTPVDVWALGVLLYFMVSGVMPFRAPNISTLKKNILEGDFEVPSHVTMDCAALIRGILRKSYRDRYTLALVVDSSWLRASMAALGSTGVRRKWGQRVASGKGPVSRHSYHPWPRLAAEQRDALEVEVRRQMARFGVTEEMIKEAMKEGCHNDVIGTYRILLDATNREMKNKKRGKEGVERQPDAVAKSEKNGDAGKKQTPTHSGAKSRTCIIL